MTALDMPLNLESLLDGINFPVAKVEIIVYADSHGASQEALNILNALPSKVYRNMQQINANLGKVEELPGSENIWSSSDASEPDSGIHSSF